VQAGVLSENLLHGEADRSCTAPGVVCWHRSGGPPNPPSITLYCIHNDPQVR